MTHEGLAGKRIVLIVASNPVAARRLDLGRELGDIRESWKRSKCRHDFDIKLLTQATSDALRRELLEVRPEVVHFCGHGSGSLGLVMEDEQGRGQHVSTGALAELFGLCKEYVRCVVLNACYSEDQARGIHRHINFVIGMKQEIGDPAAIDFSKGFYDALFAGETVERAFEFGKNAIQLDSLPESMRQCRPLLPPGTPPVEALPEHLKPVLLKRRSTRRPASLPPRRRTPWRYQVIAFDLDGTLLRGRGPGSEFRFSWELIWEHIDYPIEERRMHQSSFRHGHINYHQWCDWACGVFGTHNVTRGTLRELARSLRLTKHFREAIEALKRDGFVLAIISGGLDVFLDEKIPQANEIFDVIYINRLKYDSSGLICGVEPAGYDFEDKVTALEQICRDYGCGLGEAVYVGREFNDQWVLDKAGLGIAYQMNAPELGYVAKKYVDRDDLREILPLVHERP